MTGWVQRRVWLSGILRVQLERHADLTDAVASEDATWNDVINLEKEISRALRPGPQLVGEVPVRVGGGEGADQA
jgi:hypothetical protein